MSRLYDTKHLNLQEEFETQKLAGAVEKIIVHSEMSDEEKAFISSRDMFFLSTIDHQGRPSVSYKGGPKGFVKIIDDSTIVFPSYDGNGMFLSVGNIDINEKIGLLFIDFETPHRLRAYGTAKLLPKDDPLMDEYVDAQLLVKVTLTEIWKNCPRYVHKHERVETSKYVPRADVETPLPDWKRLDKLQPVLPSKDHGKAEQQGGTISIEELEKIEQRDD